MPPPEPLRITLPVCPVCGNVGKQHGPRPMASRCRGPAKASHAVTMMVPRTFVEEQRKEA